MAHHESGVYDRARPLYERALAVADGADHELSASILSNLAILHQAAGNLESASALGERALALREAMLPPGDPDIALSLNNLGVIYRSQGTYERALGSFERAVAIWETSVGPGHPSVALGLSNLAATHRDLGAPERALELHMQRVVDAEEANLARNLMMGSPRQQRAFLATVRDSTNFAVSLHLRDLESDPVAAALAMTTVLRRKGRALEVEASVVDEVRRSLGPTGGASIDALRLRLGARDALARRPLPDVAAWQERLSEIDAQIDILQAELARQSASFRRVTTPVAMADVQARLVPGSAVVEFISWKPLDSKGGGRWGPARYAVYVLRADGRVAWADLGPQAVLDEKIRAFRQALLAGSAWGPGARAIYDAALAPVEAAIVDTSRVYIAPDGALHRA